MRGWFDLDGPAEFLHVGDGMLWMRALTIGRVAVQVVDLANGRLLGTPWRRAPGLEIRIQELFPPTG